MGSATHAGVLTTILPNRDVTSPNSLSKALSCKHAGHALTDGILLEEWKEPRRDDPEL